jgi:hypothetical protein
LSPYSRRGQIEKGTGIEECFHTSLFRCLSHYWLLGEYVLRARLALGYLVVILPDTGDTCSAIFLGAAVERVGSVGHVARDYAPVSVIVGEAGLNVIVLTVHHACHVWCLGGASCLVGVDADRCRCVEVADYCTVGTEDGQ